MIRLPVPNEDAGEWGTILNAFLSVAHTDSGELKAAGLINGAQPKSERGQANGYASLDADGLVPISQLPPLAAASGIGDYFGVNFSDEVAASGGSIVSWTSETAHRGTSVTWTSGEDVTAAVDGVYTISLTVYWQDGDLAEDNDGFRNIGIMAGCGFTTEDQRPAVPQASNGNTNQSLQFTVYLQAGTAIWGLVGHSNSTNAAITLQARMLVTRVA